MKQASMIETIRSLPKAELHLHLEGAVTPALLKRLADRHSTEWGGREEAEIAESVFTIRDRETLALARHQILTHLRSPEDYLEVLAEIYRTMADQNIVYSEIFFSPAARWRLGLEAEEILKTLLEQSRKVEAEGGPVIRWVLACLAPLGPESARKTVDLAIKFRDQGVAAVGLQGSISGYSPDEFARIFAWAKVQGLFIHVHSGESDDPGEVWTALAQLGANRIGHGIQASRDPKLMKYLKDRATGLDICLTGNALTGAWKHSLSHPFSLLWKRGVPISLGTDNPGIYRCSLSDELENARNWFSLSLPELKELCLKSVSLSFLPYLQKMALMQKSGDRIDKIFTALK